MTRVSHIFSQRAQNIKISATKLMGEMPRGRLGVGSGLANYARVFGQSTGLSLVGTLFASLVLVQEIGRAHV